MNNLPPCIILLRNRNVFELSIIFISHYFSESKLIVYDKKKVYDDMVLEFKAKNQQSTENVRAVILKCLKKKS